MTDLCETYSFPYDEEDEYHTFLTNMGFPFSYAKQARDGVSSGAKLSIRLNAIRKLRDFFSCRRASRQDDGVEEDKETLIEKFLNRTEPEKPPEALCVDGVSETLMGEYEKLNERQRQQKTANAVAKELKEKEAVKIKSPGRGNLRKEAWHYQQFDDNEETSTTINEESALLTPSPESTQKRKRGTEEIKANKAGFDNYMKHLRAQQSAIHEGKLEQVIRPGYAPPRNTMIRPPPPLKSQPATPQSTPKRHKDTSPTSKLAPSKLKSYMTSSADLLDANRRGLTSNVLKGVGRLRPPLAGLDFHYVGILRRGNATDEDDDDDDQSFSCIGISETQLRVSTPELERARRISGDGIDLWTEKGSSSVECRMCHRCRPSAGLRGLCRECENAFQRSMKSFSRLSQDEAKPPVSLKTTKNRTKKRTSSFREEFHPSPTSSDDSERFIDHCAGRIPAELGRAPSIASQHGKMGRVGGNSHTPQRRTEFVSIYERWQTPEMRAELAKREALRWSSSLLGREDTRAMEPVKLSLRTKFSTS